MEPPRYTTVAPTTKCSISTTSRQGEKGCHVEKQFFDEWSLLWQGAQFGDGIVDASYGSEREAAEHISTKKPKQNRQGKEASPHLHLGERMTDVPSLGIW